MTDIIRAQKGTHDILPSEMKLWYKMEENACRIFSNAGYGEIRTPIFEATELFARGVGDTTDIVSKEMYSFKIKERNLTLRPENTAGIVRSFIENGMHRLSAPVKLWYKGPMFRYERPQSGRQRQFHQLGVEIFGIKEPTADAEVIELALDYLKSLGLENLSVEINSIGCINCRNVYKNKLKSVLKPYLDILCADCKIRYNNNPLRLLDCKSEKCRDIFEKPEVKNLINGDFICPDCHEHFETLKSYLDVLNINYSVNKMLVRGLDYYNGTVFEIKSSGLGTQNTICGGGRYDGLMKNLGGIDTPAAGFAMGMERLYSLMKNLKSDQTEKLNAYIVSDNTAEALKLVKFFRNNNKSADFDFRGKNFTKQMEKAAKTANYAVILGENEIASDTVSIKNLETSEQINVKREDVLNYI